MLIKVPADIMYIASQFASSDEIRESITGIHLKPEDNGVRIGATNGHIAFRCLVPYGHHCSMGNDQAALLPAAPFKKKVAYARKVDICNGLATFAGGKKNLMELLEARPCKPSESEFPPSFDDLWEQSNDDSKWSKWAFTASYMKTISTIVEKYSETGVAKVSMTGPVSPIAILASSGDLTLQFLLMPVQVPDWH